MNAGAGQEIRVLVVDDSATFRSYLSRVLDADPKITVVGTAVDGRFAVRKIEKLRPHVVTMDVHMVTLDGVAAVREIMRTHPTPVVMVSSSTERGAQTTLDALQAGAVDFVHKAEGVPGPEYERELRRKVRTAASARVRSRAPTKPGPSPGPSKRPAGSSLSTAWPSAAAVSTLVAIGASTGGTVALEEILRDVPAGFAPIVITQHIPERFSGPFARRLDSSSAMRVVEVTPGVAIEPGGVYVARGGSHLVVRSGPSGLHCELGEGPRVNGHKPSVDVMFRSIARLRLRRVVAVQLTGMGDDGARGMLQLRRAGARTFAQDEASSVVWSMPRSAIEIGAVEEVVPLKEIASRLLDTVASRSSAA